MEKNHSFMRGVIVGVVIGILGMGGGEYIAGQVKVSLLTYGAKIINVHEHIESMAEVPKLLQTMSLTGIEKVILIGSPEQTIRYDGETGFSGFDKNNEEILNIIDQYPETFVAFVTIDSADPNKLEKLKNYVNKGAKGLKLYNGHSFFYKPDFPLDEESMMEVYKYCEENSIPLIFHVNLNSYEAEFIKVMDTFPKLKVNCPHFCLSSKNLTRLGEMFDKYPNLYTDISFGYKDYLVAGFDTISGKTDKFREFISKYNDRFMYGTDLVITSFEGKSVDWMSKVFQGYRDLLEEKTFSLFLKDEYLEKLKTKAIDGKSVKALESLLKSNALPDSAKEAVQALSLLKNDDAKMQEVLDQALLALQQDGLRKEAFTYNGLQLAPEVLNLIYQENYKRLFEPPR